MDTVLDLAVDKNCKAYPEEPNEKNPVEKCPSTDAIPTGHNVLQHFIQEPDHQALDNAGQKAVVELFTNLQEAHDNLSKITGSIWEWSPHPSSSTSSAPHTTQANLCSPTELKLAKE